MQCSTPKSATASHKQHSDDGPVAPKLSLSLSQSLIYVCLSVVSAQRSQHGVLVALRHPRVSVCVFPSGKVISMGAKSEASALLGCRKVARMVQRLPGYEAVRVSDFRVHNVTASGALGYRIDLRALARHPLHEEHVEVSQTQHSTAQHSAT